MGISNGLDQGHIRIHICSDWNQQVKLNISGIQSVLTNKIKCIINCGLITKRHQVEMKKTDFTDGRIIPSKFHTYSCVPCQHIAFCKCR